MNLAKLQDTKSIHRNYLHFYILTEKSERAIKESILFTIATKRIKYLGINLPKEMKELYTENYDTNAILAGFDSWVRKIPWRRKWKPTPVFLPGESHG